MMSARSHKKGKEHHAKAVFVASSAPMTKSRNMAEENILRHKLKGLDDQRRRSIMAMKEEEKVLIRDLETQRHGSGTLQAADIDKFNTKKDQLEVKYSNGSRGKSCISSDENGNIMTKIETESKGRLSMSNNDDNTCRNDMESRKHLWKYPKSSSMTSNGDAKTLDASGSKKCARKAHSESDKKDMYDIVREFSLEHNQNNVCDNVSSSNGHINGSDKHGELPFQPRDQKSMPPKSVLSKTKSIDLGGTRRRYDNKEITGIWPDKTRTTREIDRPTKPRTKAEERRDRSMMTLKNRSGSLKWSSFEELDNELNSAYGMIDKHAKKLSRSININIGDEANEKKIASSCVTSNSVAEYNHLKTNLTKSIKQLSNSLHNISLSSDNAKPQTITRSTSRRNIRSNVSNKSLQICDDTFLQSPLDKIETSVDQHKGNRLQTNQTESFNVLNSTTSSLSPQKDFASSKYSDRRNSVGRNKIILSPIGSRRPKSPTSSYVPSFTEKRKTKKQSMMRKRVHDRIEHMNSCTVNHATSDSDSGGSNLSKKGSIPDSCRESSKPCSQDLPVRPVSSWSQRKRSIVFGEKSPQTPREVLNDTHAQWEELGDFLGEIRKHHNTDHSRLSSAKQNCKTVNSSVHYDGHSRRDSSFATLMEQRLLPRRHSESNIILLSHAAKGKKDGLDLRQGVTPRHSRRKSCIPPDQSCVVAGLSNTNNTSVKKLVTIHNALQTSALSMADMESEMF